jgi:hypothetical protein
MRKPLVALGVLVSLFLFPACGGGGGGGGSGASADVLIGDAPVDDLLSFSAVVQSVRLQRDDLSFTGDLVGSLEVEFLGLNGSFAFLAKGRIAPGTYVAAEIGFKPGSYLARADDSSPVVIVPASDTYLAQLAAPLVVAAGDYVRFTVDLNLLNSLSGTVGSGTLDFDPNGSCESNDGSEDEPIDELRGTVQSMDSVARTIVVDGSVGEPPTHIGQVTLQVTDATVLLDNDNGQLSVSAFFAAIHAGTFLEVDGDLGSTGSSPPRASRSRTGAAAAAPRWRASAGTWLRSPARSSRSRSRRSRTGRASSSPCSPVSPTTTRSPSPSTGARNSCSTRAA